MHRDRLGLELSAARVLPAWDQGMSGYGHVLALHAFGLEESGDYVAAERTGRRATELNPADPWAVHAVAHVMEMQDRAADGIAWIESLAPLRKELWQLGGSHAQRDLFALILLDSALKSANRTLARMLLDERAALRPNGKLPREFTSLSDQPA